MSLTAEQYLTVCAAAQLTQVAPALEGSYAGGTAGSIGALLLMAVQDIAARPAREAAEQERLQALFGMAAAKRYSAPQPAGLPALRAAIGGLLEEAERSGDDEMRRRVLDHFTLTAEAARLSLPAPPAPPT